MALKQPFRNGRKSLLVLVLLLLLVLTLVFMPFHLIAKKSPKSNWEAKLLQSKYKAIGDILVAQAKHESNNLQSPLYRGANNLFGFKTYQVTRFPVPANEKKPGDPNYYIEFTDPESSAQYMIDWLQRHHIPTEAQSLDKYVRRLHDVRFFTDTPERYAKGVARFL